jgi:hypothetical protein
VMHSARALFGAVDKISEMNRSDPSRLFFFCDFRSVIYMPRMGVQGMLPTFVDSDTLVFLF